MTTSAGSPRTERVALEGAPNFRDLGGHRTSDGRVVRCGRVFRSGHLADLTDDDLTRLGDLGVRTVIDFRLPFEVGVFGPDRLPPGASYVAAPITAGGMDAATQEALRKGNLAALPDLVTANRRLVRNSHRQLGDLFHMLAEPANLPLVIHCIGGKDRTGVASALVLSMLGVPWDTVQQDYLRTNEHTRERVEEYLAFLAGTTDRGGSSSIDGAQLEAARRFLILEPEYIDAARDEMIALAGSVAGYVHERLGVAPPIIARLRDHLLEPSGTEPPPERGR